MPLQLVTLGKARLPVFQKKTERGLDKRFKSFFAHQSVFAKWYFNYLTASESETFELNFFEKKNTTVF